MIPLLGLGSLIAKAAAVAVIPRVIKALSALGGPTEPVRATPSEPKPEHVSAPVQPTEKLLYKRNPLTDHNYRYSTYGERTKEAGDLDSDFGYGGLFHHGPSGLDLATHRIYDSTMGRWISRDPLGEGVDYNLYRYCGNSPMNRVDPSGKSWLFPEATLNYWIIPTSEGYELGIVGSSNDAYIPPIDVKVTVESEVQLFRADSQWLPLKKQTITTFPIIKGVNCDVYGHLSREQLKKWYDQGVTEIRITFAPQNTGPPYFMHSKRGSGPVSYQSHINSDGTLSEGLWLQRGTMIMPGPSNQ